jgi:hypothetical protein
MEESEGFDRESFRSRCKSAGDEGVMASRRRRRRGFSLYAFSLKPDPFLNPSKDLLLV